MAPISADAGRLQGVEQVAGKASLQYLLEDKSEGDTMTEPTDAELWQFYMTLPGATPTSQPDPIEIMRAVLAKWGTPPVVAGEPDNAFQLASKIYKRLDEWVLEVSGTINDCNFTCRHTQPGNLRPEDVAGLPTLYTTQQPTQEQAVNQADRPFIVRLAEDFADDCVTAGYVTTKAASYGRLMDEALSTQAQAGAVPLTDEQLAEMMRETWGCASIAPRHAIGFARAIERAHGIGIKGGQHGAE